jgi:hypothetical protein
MGLDNSKKICTLNHTIYQNSIQLFYMVIITKITEIYALYPIKYITTNKRIPSTTFITTNHE